jgi:general L-amino acid transport system permease protein
MAVDDTTRSAAALPPPRMETGVAGWARTNLFSSLFNGLLTVIAGVVTLLALWYGLKWVFLDAEWRVIVELGGRFILGQYNTQSACPGQNCFWRPQVATLLATLLLGMGWGLTGRGVTRVIAITVAVVLGLLAFLPYSLEAMGYDVRLLLLANLPALLAGWVLARHTLLGTGRRVAVLAVASFLLSLVLIRGLPGIPGLQPVSVNQWGGLMLNLILAIGGITLSLPIGIALALGRRSRLPIVKILCITFIEVFRGVPLITLLFMSRHLVPLAFPEDFPQNALLNAAIVITLFSSAYMAENIRGGLQALHPGQAEAARALGLPGWHTTLLISLPQAIRNVIPAIVGQFIGLFKDTSLVYIIGMLDILRIGLDFVNGNIEFRDNKGEVIIFVALVFWIFTYGMSYVSGHIERHLGVGER